MPDTGNARWLPALALGKADRAGLGAVGSVVSRPHADSGKDTWECVHCPCTLASVFLTLCVCVLHAAHLRSGVCVLLGVTCASRSSWTCVLLPVGRLRSPEPCPVSLCFVFTPFLCGGHLLPAGDTLVNVDIRVEVGRPLAPGGSLLVSAMPCGFEVLCPADWILTEGCH